MLTTAGAAEALAGDAGDLRERLLAWAEFRDSRYLVVEKLNRHHDVEAWARLSPDDFEKRYQDDPEFAADVDGLMAAVDRFRYLGGSITDLVTGESVSGAVLEIPLPAFLLRASTNGLGDYGVLVGWEHGDSLSVTATKKGYLNQTLAVVFDEPIQLGKDFALLLAPQDYSVEGRVLDAKGKPLRDVAVTVSSPEGGLAKTRTNPAGGFRAQISVPPYTRVEVEARSGEATVSRQVPIPGDDRPVELVLDLQYAVAEPWTPPETSVRYRPRGMSRREVFGEARCQGGRVMIKTGEPEFPEGIRPGDSVTLALEVTWEVENLTEVPLIEVQGFCFDAEHQSRLLSPLSEGSERVEFTFVLPEERFRLPEGELGFSVRTRIDCGDFEPRDETHTVFLLYERGDD